MPQPPGAYPDGRGNIRYWDGRSWTSKVSTGSGWRDDHDVPSGSPPGEFWRDHTVSAPPHRAAHDPGDPAVNPFPAVPAGAGGCLVVGFALVLLPRLLWKAYLGFIHDHRWALLAALVVVTAAWAVRRIAGRPRLLGRVAGAAVWGALLISTVGGFRHDDGPPPPPTHDPVAEARKVLVAAGKGDTGLCAGMPIELTLKVRDHYGFVDCHGALEEIGRQTDERELEELKNVQVTVVGERDVTPCCGLLAEATTYVTVRLGPNPLGWTQMEFAPGAESGILHDIAW